MTGSAFLVKCGGLQVSLELGGKSPHLVFESADLEQGQWFIFVNALVLFRSPPCILASRTERVSHTGYLAYLV